MDPRYRSQPNRSQPGRPDPNRAQPYRQPSSRDLPPDADPRYADPRYRDPYAGRRQPPDYAPDRGREAQYDSVQRSAPMRQPPMPQAPSHLTPKRMLFAVGGVAATVLLCVISIYSGMLLSGSLNRPPDIASTAKQFFIALEGQDYSTAFSYMNPRVTQLPQFQDEATSADNTLGPIVSWTQGPQVGGTQGAKTGSATYKVTRSGGTFNGKKIPQATYDIAMSFAYSNGQWQIVDLGNLVDYKTLMQPGQSSS